MPHLTLGLALGLAVAAGVYFSDLRSTASIIPRPASTPPQRATAPAPASQQRQAAPQTSRPAAGGAAGSTAARDAAARNASAGSAGGATSPTQANDASTSAKQDDGAPDFEFYDILPQYEVVVPEVETVERSAAPAAATTPVTAPGTYILQTGSFRSHTDADRMQASLALLGIESRIQRVTIDADEFHRVRVGPISDLDELDRIRGELRRAGVDSLMMKVND